MFKALRIAALAALAAAAAGAASANDLLPPLPSLDEPILQTLTSDSGWYVRGDLGYGAARFARASPLGGPARTDFFATKIRDGFTLGGGLGYRYNSYLRADVTLEHRFASRFSGNTTLIGAPDHRFGHQGDFSALTGLVNLYADLGAWSSVTPYVGAGLGVSSNRFSRHEIAECAAPCGGVFTEVARLPDRSRLGFAWALTAGLGVDLGGGGTLDLGYRYLNLGDGRTGASAANGAVEVRKLETHAVRVGFRWSLN